MDRSSTSSEKSRAEVLSARDRRQRIVSRYLAARRPATVVLSLAIPGREKQPQGAYGLFCWALRKVKEAFPAGADPLVTCDGLGPFAILRPPVDPAAAKRKCTEIEAGSPSARLVDLDVYDASGGQVDRRRLGLPPRPCLVCGEPAVDCIRLKRHLPGAAAQAAGELLKPFEGRG